VFLAPVGVRLRVAVRTKDSEVLEPVVRADAVDVVELECDGFPIPLHTTPALHTPLLKDAFLDEALSEVGGASVGAVLDKNLRQGDAVGAG